MSRDQPPIQRRTYTLPVQTTILSLETDAAGTGWVTFDDEGCQALDVINETGVDIEYRRNDAGATIIIAAGSSRLVTGITNANEVGIRRVDQTGIQVDVSAEACIF